MITYINTDEVESISEEILTAADDLDAEFEALFKRFANVPNVTKEWVGTQANFYFSRIASDKQQYTTFIEKIRKIGQELKSEASSAKTQIVANNK